MGFILNEVIKTHRTYVTCKISSCFQKRVTVDYQKAAYSIYYILYTVPSSAEFHIAIILYTIYYILYTVPSCAEFHIVIRSFLALA